jgi:hypothetical protein
MAEIIHGLKGFTTRECLYLNDTSKYPLPGTPAPCLMCGQPYLCRTYHGVPDPVCEMCYDEYHDCASVKCSVCNVVIAKVVPKIMPNGYYIRPRTVLHTDKCGICQPNLTESVIIELDEYEKTTRPKKLILPMVLPKETD